jgi:hypothetical protein
MFRRKTPLILALALIAVTLSAVVAGAQQPPIDPARAIAGPPLSSPHFQLNWNVTANGGGTVTSPHFQVSSTVGQPATGISDSANFEVCSGFWCKVLAFFEVQLPVITKNLTP